MPLLEWDDKKLSVGIKLIDDQHRVLIGYINELADAVENKSGDDLIESIFDKLYNYTQYHFHEEESYFYKLNKNDLALHKLQHKHFIEELARIKCSSVSDNEICESLLYFLSDWLVNHIISEDLKFIEKNKTKRVISPATSIS